MGVLGTIVEASAGPMLHAGQDLALRDAVAAEPIRDDLARLVLQAGEEAFEEAFSGRAVPPLLHQDVEHDTVLVHRAPEIEELAVDLQVHLILSAKSEVFEIPMVSVTKSAASERCARRDCASI